MSENPVMTFTIKKRINTEVFIDWKQGLYIPEEQIKKRGKLKWAKVGADANN